MKDTTDLVFIVANKKKQANLAQTSETAVPTLFPDCTVSIEHKWDSDITEHPIERGVSVADHIVNKNPVFSVDGIFNQHTVDTYFGNVVNGQQRIKDAYDYLLSLRNNRLPFTLVSKYASYRDCVVKSLSIPVAPTDGNNTLIFSMEIQQIRFAQNEEVTLVRAVEVAPPFVDTASPKESKGNSQVGLTVFENNPFAPKGKKTTRVQDNLTKIPYRFGG
jgi:hypothetical protein